MPIKKRPLKDGLPVADGFDGYECTICGAHSYNPQKMSHKLDCPEIAGHQPKFYADGK